MQNHQLLDVYHIRMSDAQRVRVNYSHTVKSSTPLFPFIGLAPSPTQRIRKNIKASLVNLTLNMRYKITKKCQICHHQICFFKLKMHQNPFSAPDPAGEAYDAPQTHPRSTPLASRTSQAPSTQNPGYASVTNIMQFLIVDNQSTPSLWLKPTMG